jgi:hypothetical protein
MTTVRIGHADHVAPSSLKKLALILLTNGGLSVGMDFSPTRATVFSLAINIRYTPLGLNSERHISAQIKLSELDYLVQSSF